MPKTRKDAERGVGSLRELDTHIAFNKVIFGLHQELFVGSHAVGHETTLGEFWVARLIPATAS